MLSRLFRGLLVGHSTRPARRGATSDSARPGLEALETRDVPSYAAVPVLHGNPAAAVKIYLDFDGHAVERYWAKGARYNPAFSLDEDTLQLSAATPFASWPSAGTTSSARW